MTKRQAQLAAIKKNAKAVFTKPEIQMKGILDELLISYLGNQHVEVKDYDSSTYSYQLDFVIPNHGCFWTLLEINGHHHQTPKFKKKDGWRAGLILDRAISGPIFSKVIEYDAEFLRLKKFRPLAIEALRKALASTDRIVWCDA
jgi:hypothetical protein